MSAEQFRESRDIVNIGVIVTIAGPPHNESDGVKGTPRKRIDNAQAISQLLMGSPAAACDVLGQSITDRVIARLRGFGTQRISIISEGKLAACTATSANASLYRAGSTPGFWPAWDSVVSDYLNQGIETLLLVRLGPYVELDLPDLLRFHRENSSPLTQVYHRQTALDLVMVDATRLRDGVGSFRSRLSALIPQRQRYAFTGYTNRLAEPADFRRLVKDALFGRCGIRPAGREVRPGIWYGENARVDHSATILAPAFIGAETCVEASCTISGASAVERQCEVDCGTAVDDCCVFPGTYLGMGLNVTHALVKGSRLFHLNRNIEVEIGDSRLIGTTAPSRQLGRRARSVLGANGTFGSSLVTRSSQLASLLTTRRFGRLS
jgi:hypothetical protein